MKKIESDMVEALFRATTKGKVSWWYFNKIYTCYLANTISIDIMSDTRMNIYSPNLYSYTIGDVNIPLPEFNAGKATQFDDDLAISIELDSRIEKAMGIFIPPISSRPPGWFNYEYALYGIVQCVTAKYPKRYPYLDLAGNTIFHIDPRTFIMLMPPYSVLAINMDGIDYASDLSDSYEKSGYAKRITEVARTFYTPRREEVFASIIDLMGEEGQPEQILKEDIDEMESFIGRIRL